MTIYVFTDASYSPQKNIGVGGYIIVKNLQKYDNLEIKELKEILSSKIKYINSNEGSTNIELKTIEIVLNKLKGITDKIIVHTDCQKALKIQTYDNVEIIKISGHTKQINRITTQDKIFDVVDKLSRKRLRTIIKNTNYLTRDPC